MTWLKAAWQRILNNPVVTGYVVTAGSAAAVKWIGLPSEVAVGLVVAVLGISALETRRAVTPNRKIGDHQNG